MDLKSVQQSDWVSFSWKVFLNAPCICGWKVSKIRGNVALSLLPVAFSTERIFSELRFRPPASFLLAHHNRSSGLPGLLLPIFAKDLVRMLRRRMGRVSPWGFLLPSN